MRKRLLLPVLVIAVLLISCSNGTDQEGPPLTTLKIGVLPDENEESLRGRYAPLLAFLSRETGIPSTLFIPDSYGELLAWFANGKVDLAHFGGATFVKAHDDHGAIPLVMRDVDTRFSSLFVARTDHPAKKLAEFKGKSLAFGSRLSTSGHMMPRYFLRHKKGITPEEWFDAVVYSGKHDKTVHWVRDGVVDLGVVNAAIYRSMLAKRRIEPDELHIIWETPPYTDYVWAVRGAVAKEDCDKIRMAFLKLSSEKEEFDLILSKMRAGGYLPANMNDFAKLQQVMNSLDQR